MSAQGQGQRYKFYKILAWALLGFVFTYIVCAMSLTTDHTIWTPFYNQGDVSEIALYNYFNDSLHEEGYQEDSDTVVLEQGPFHVTMSIDNYTDKWHYLCVRLDDLSSESLTWKVAYENVQDEVVTESTTETYELTEGMNSLPVPETYFNRAAISIYGEDGCSFCIAKMQLQENLPPSHFTRAIVAGILTVICYLVLSGILFIIYRKSGRKWRIPFYGGIEILQECYLAVAGRLAALQSKVHINPKRRRIIRTCLFLGMLYYAMSVIFEKNYNPGFRYTSLIIILFISAIALFSIEEKPKKKNWNNPLVWGWLVVIIMMCISDFVVPKQADYYPFVGYILLVFIGFFIFVWNNMKNREEIIKDFVRAVHVLFWIVLIYCILFRPHDPAVRYAGITPNPNNLSFYTTIFWAVVLGSMEQVIRTHGKKRMLLFYIIEGCLVFSLAWKTQSITGLLAIALVAMIWLVRMIIYTFRNKRKKVLMGTLICAIVLFLPLHAALSFGLTHVSESLGTDVAYEDEVLIERTEIGTVAYAAESGGRFSDNRIINKLTSTSMGQFLSGRTYIYKEYLRDLNWFGHDTYLSVFGQDNPRHGHNDVLNQASRYGIFTIVPYVVMLVAVLERTWRFGRKNISYAIVPFFVCLVAIVESMEDIALDPLQFPTWYGLYLLMGCVFCEDSLIEEKEDSCYIKKV